MSSVKHDLKIDKNSTYVVKFDFYNDDDTSLNINDYIAEFVVREINSINSEIILVADQIIIKDYSITIKISANTSKSTDRFSGYYNLILKKDDEKHRVLEGQVLFTGTIDEN